MFNFFSQATKNVLPCSFDVHNYVLMLLMVELNVDCINIIFALFVWFVYASIDVFCYWL